MDSGYRLLYIEMELLVQLICFNLYNLQKLEDDLETTNERLDKAEPDFIGKFFGLLSGFVFVVLLIVVILLLFGRHVKQK